MAVGGTGLASAPTEGGERANSPSLPEFSFVSWLELASPSREAHVGASASGVAGGSRGARGAEGVSVVAVEEAGAGTVDIASPRAISCFSAGVPEIAKAANAMVSANTPTAKSEMPIRVGFVAGLLALHALVSGFRACIRIPTVCPAER